MIGKVLKDRYKIIENIGQGGMAEVYKAHDQRLGRYVALKILKVEFSSNREFIHRFYREACSAAKLSHPNIVSVFDIEEDDGLQFIVMEYLEAQNLKSFLKKIKKPLQESELIEITKNILGALSFAHQKGIIHRDLKPHNILITKESIVKVTDFGIARALFSDTITQTGSFMGSVHYFSPEQAQGKPTTAPADIYSLGILMFEVITGKLPFEGDNPVSIALKHVQEPPPNPSSFNPSISLELEKIILKALKKDPLLRYQKAEEMLADLESLSSEKKEKRTKTSKEPQLIMSSPSVKKEVEEVSYHIKSRKNDHVEEDAPVRNESPFLKGLVLFTVILIFIVFTVILLIYGSRFVQEIETPDLIGKSYTDAQRIADEKGLRLDIQNEIFNDNKPEGTILEQKPSAGEKIKPGNTIYVTISKGNKTVEVPDLVGVTLERSMRILKDRGLTNVKVKEEFSEKIQEGMVISQEPSPQNMISPSSTIVLVVSKGPTKQKIPDLTGKTKEDAQKILSRIELKLAIEGTEPSAQIPANCIIRQDPVAGNLIVKNSTVKVIISKGLDGVTSPNLIGKTILEAQEILEPLGISLIIEGDEKGQNSLISSQSPQPGEPLDEKIITVKAEGLAIIPELIGKKINDARDTLQKKGFQIGNLIYKEASDTPSDVVLEQDPQSGLEVPQGEKINLVISKTSSSGHGTGTNTPPFTPVTPEPTSEASPQASPQPKSSPPK